jgi:hypothetical protein
MGDFRHPGSQVLLDEYPLATRVIIIVVLTSMAAAVTGIDVGSVRVVDGRFTLNVLSWETVAILWLRYGSV